MMTLHRGCARGADVYFLRRFLRARQHDLKKAKEMYAASIKWRREFGVEEVAANFHFTERDAFIALYPQGYHKTDKLVRSHACFGVGSDVAGTRSGAGSGLSRASPCGDLDDWWEGGRAVHRAGMRSGLGERGSLAISVPLHRAGAEVSIAHVRALPALLAKLSTAR